MKTIITALAVCLSTGLYAQDGTANGNYSASFESGAQSSVIAVQPDGKIIQAGPVIRLGTGNVDVGIVRYNAIAGIDNTFGSSGKVATPVGTFEDYAYAVAVQPDGKILVAGSTTIDHVTYNLKAFVLRYNSNGTLDPTFGTSGKSVLTTTATSTSANALVLQPDGKIVIAGRASTSKSNVFVARLNSDGTFDNSFNSIGYIISSPGSFIDVANAVALQSNGKIVIAGNSYSANSSEASNFLLMRFNSDGTPDATFNGSGTATSTTIANGTGKAVAVQQDGKIVVGGSGMNPGNSNSTDLVLIRYSSLGALDNTFAGTGILYSPMVGGQTTDYANSIIMQADNKIVIGGNLYYGGAAGTNLVIARFTTAGALDNTFASSGKYFPATSYGAYGTVAFQGTNILGGSISNETSGNSFYVVRLNNSVGAALPISLQFFSVQKQGVGSLLEWKTSYEINTRYFEIERSGDGVIFKSIGKVNGSNNSVRQISYSFLDAAPLKGINYYRLKAIDFDGRIIISPAKMIRFSELNSSQVKYYPNPTNGMLNINETKAAPSEPVNVNIMGVSGEILGKNIPCNFIGDKITIDMKGYSKGIYLVHVKTADTDITCRVVLQ